MNPEVKSIYKYLLVGNQRTRNRRDSISHIVSYCKMEWDRGFRYRIAQLAYSNRHVVEYPWIENTKTIYDFLKKEGPK